MRKTSFQSSTSNYGIISNNKISVFFFFFFYFLFFIPIWFQFILKKERVKVVRIWRRLREFVDYLTKIERSCCLNFIICTTQSNTWFVMSTMQIKIITYQPTIAHRFNRLESIPYLNKSSRSAYINESCLDLFGWWACKSTIRFFQGVWEVEYLYSIKVRV